MSDVYFKITEHKTNKSKERYGTLKRDTTL